MNLRPIKTNADHQRALADLTAILEQDPAPESSEAERAEVLGALIERYEAEHFPVELPTPIEAIRFRMDQLGLKQKDLVPFIGSASKVSEVLNGKRSLSLTMVRKLHEGLGIPAEVLIQEEGEGTYADDPEDFPLREMYKRGYFEGAPADYKRFHKSAGKWLDQLLEGIGVREESPAFARSTAHYRGSKSIHHTAFVAWQARVLQKSRQISAADYRQGVVDEAFLTHVAGLSVLDEGPLRAREFLEKSGIRLVVERHLPGTYLDGAALLRDDGDPVIGLTLRHDRLDNFWFTLLHELVHVGWHLTGDRVAFFDTLDSPAGTDGLEREADRRAADALIPPDKWKEAEVRNNPKPNLVREFACQIHRHPSVVAGRLRRDTDDYRLLASLVGNRQVRQVLAG